MKQLSVFLVAISSVLLCGFGSTHHQIVTNGKVVLVKYRAFQDMEFVYGAFVITDTSPPTKQSNGSIVNDVYYQWVLETHNGRKSGEAKIRDHFPIQFGENFASPGANLLWSYRNPSQGYIESAILGATFGTYVCLTELSQIPTTTLSEIECTYLEVWGNAPS